MATSLTSDDSSTSTSTTSSSYSKCPSPSLRYTTFNFQRPGAAKSSSSLPGRLTAVKMAPNTLGFTGAKETPPLFQTPSEIGAAESLSSVLGDAATFNKASDTLGFTGAKDAPLTSPKSSEADAAESAFPVLSGLAAINIATRVPGYADVSKTGGYYRYHCKFWELYQCENRVWVNGTVCIDCCALGRK